jgi:hypothetical protein
VSSPRAAEIELALITDKSLAKTSLRVQDLWGMFKCRASDPGEPNRATIRRSYGRVALKILTFLALIVPLSTSCAQEIQPTLSSGDVFTPSFKALFVLFILAVILESGLAIIFDWKLFVSTLDTKAAKPIIAVLVATVFVHSYGLDIVTTLVNLYTGAKYPMNPGGQLLTALVIAGGSAGVNKLLQALGFRAVQQAPPPVVKPPPTVAWLAVTLKRSRAVGRVNVLAGPTGDAKLVGTIAGAGLANNVLRFFLRDSARFPQSGGYSLEPGIFEVRLDGVDKDGTNIHSTTWGPYSIAAGSIVDIELIL